MSDLSSAPVLPRLPRLNEPAPDFRAKSTHGDIALADFRGKWVVLFSHPADFTPVCTTEFVGFSQLHSEFDAEDAQLIAVSVDSLFSHIAWIRNIESHFGVKVNFPVVADVDMRVSSAYGMVHPGASDTSPVRCLFIIDPDGFMRAMIYYPITTGRNMHEVLRLLRALRMTTEHGVACPANWMPGDEVIVPTPQTLDEAEARMSEGLRTVDWYFSHKSV